MNWGLGKEGWWWGETGKKAGRGKLQPGCKRERKRMERRKKGRGRGRK